MAEVTVSMGVVDFWSPRGFVLPDDGTENLFFHCSSLEGERGQRFIAEGTRIEFETGTRNGKKCAVKVWPVEGAK